MTLDPLRTIIERYQPTMLDVVAGASSADIARLEAVAGALPESYRAFLAWMGERCPFLDGHELGYTPAALLEVYDDPEDQVANGFILIGIDNSGSGYDVHIRRANGAVVRLSEYYEAVTNEEILVENLSVASYLLTAYVRKTLAPSHPFNFAAAFKGDDAQIRELWRRVDETCGRFDISYPIDMPDFRFYGGQDFVVGVHQRPGSLALNLHFGAVDRSRFEGWYDLVFDRWQMIRMPE